MRAYIHFPFPHFPVFPLSDLPYSTFLGARVLAAWLGFYFPYYLRYLNDSIHDFIIDPINNEINDLINDYMIISTQSTLLAWRISGFAVNIEISAGLMI